MRAVDPSTLEAYDRGATSFAATWAKQPAPTDLHKTVLRWFRRGPTADIGCGSGRDTAWLCHNGFPTIGYDPSAGLLTEARRLYPNIDFRRSALPELTGVADDAFANVLCETVIMHLEAEVIPVAIRALLRILAPEGTLYLSWREGETTSRRDEHGRLYASVDDEIVRRELSAATILIDERLTTISSRKLVRRMVARKSASGIVSS